MENILHLARIGCRLKVRIVDYHIIREHRSEEAREVDDVDSDEFRVTKLWTLAHRYPGANWKLAAACGFSPTTLSQYINGRVEITPKHVIALCLELDCNPEDVVGWADLISSTTQLEDTLRAAI